MPRGPYRVAVERGDLTYAAATLECELVEINSPAELAEVEQIAMAAGIPRFWVRPRWNGISWQSPGDCPSVYAWSVAQPQVSGAQPTCAVHEPGIGTATLPCDSICEH